MEPDIAALRQEYRKQSLRKNRLLADPISQFEKWFEEALRSDVTEPNAMTLATVGVDGQPSARMVLLKEVGPDGFTFFTNFKSRKAAELDQNGRAALVFWWQELERQVRVEGSIAKVSDEAADQYFERRPRRSQLGAWASPQSQVVEGRRVLEERLEEARQKFEGADIPRPPHWGGYLVKPNMVEFWQGGEGRLHDRLRWRRTAEDAWEVHRLGP